MNHLCTYFFTLCWINITVKQKYLKMLSLINIPALKKLEFKLNLKTVAWCSRNPVDFPTSHKFDFFKINSIL